MVPVMSLVLPIVISAVVVFVASSIIHMVLPYHKGDMRVIPAGKEDEVLDALRRINIPPGQYGAPHPDPSSYAKKFTSKYLHRTIGGGVGHNLPQEAPKAFADAIIDADHF